MIKQAQHFFVHIAWNHVAIAALKIVVVVFLARLSVVMAKKLLHRLITRMTGVPDGTKHDRVQRLQTLMALFGQVTTILVWLFAVAIILAILSIDIRPLLAGAGVAGLAVGFGAQNLVKDTISGLFIILENQVSVGDVAIINGTGGLVEQINLRTMVLRDLEGTVHVFRNGIITTLSNKTTGWSAAVINIGVAYDTDVDRAIELMKQVGKELREDSELGPKIIDDIEIFGLDKFADSALMIMGRIKTRPLEQWTIGRAFNGRIKKTFDREGIEIPFPYRTLTVKGDNFPVTLATTGHDKPVSAL